MLDLKFIRENTDQVRRAVAARKDEAPIDRILSLDETRRQNLTELDALSGLKGWDATTEMIAESKRELNSFKISTEGWKHDDDLLMWVKR